ncbi:unnamed protein product [Darwinula stevensoni]|uniref:Uncharacterized protein n=1 Tax=Darwinula stevensoni TaxID=69355 RepID=A0A7R8X9N5_9CRUS|nr:unnamed protein product [Darwinula stevensoni]CAG0889817.1 unnamed protein product [Darwinula stevensoni]
MGSLDAEEASVSLDDDREMLGVHSASDDMHPPILEEGTPFFLQNLWTFVTTFFTNHGWLTLGLIFIILWLWGILKPKFQKWAQSREDHIMAAAYHKDPDLVIQRHEKAAEARLRLQEKYDQDAAAYAERMRQKEEEKRKAKLQQMEREGRALGTTGKMKVEERKPTSPDTNSCDVRPRRNVLRADFNPLMGPSGGAFRPQPRGGESCSHAVGLECWKRGNLLAFGRDENTVLVYTSGNLLCFYDVAKSTTSFFELSQDVKSVTCLAGSREKNLIGIGERLRQGCVIKILEWPSMEEVSSLECSDASTILSLSFNCEEPSLICSVTSIPPCMLTIWDWKVGGKMLEKEAHPSLPVYSAAFSSYNKGFITSVGEEHIRFWRLADTLTGLKLKCEEGKFGLHDVSDFQALLNLPDGKAVTGNFKGNVYLWERSQVKIEAKRTGGKPAHGGSIVQCFLEEGELTTLGGDGVVRVWDYESMENGDPPIIGLDPMNELRIPGACPHSMVRSASPSTPHLWFVQDQNGGIWEVDLSFSLTAASPRRLMSAHSSPVMGLSSSPTSHVLTSCGQDGRVIIYQVLQKKITASLQFSALASTLLWIPPIVGGNGQTLAVGFEDGILRLLLLHQMASSLCLIQVLKPHSTAITALSVCKEPKLLVTGSTDLSVFVFSICARDEDPLLLVLTPLIFVPLEAVPQIISFAPQRGLLVGCNDGQVLEFPFAVADLVQDSEGSYLKYMTVGKIYQVQSHSLKIFSILHTGHEEFSLLWQNLKGGQCIESHFRFDQKSSNPIKETVWSEAMTCVSEHFNGHLVMGTHDGGVAVVDPKHPRKPQAEIFLHNTSAGPVRAVNVSHDSAFAFSAGADGNVFFYSLTGEEPPEEVLSLQNLKGDAPLVADIEDPAHPSLEVALQNTQREKEMKTSEERKAEVKREVARLRKAFKQLLLGNEKLPIHMRLKEEDLRLDEQVYEPLEQQFQAEKRKVEEGMRKRVELARCLYEKLHSHLVLPWLWEPLAVKAVRAEVMVETIPVKKFPPELKAEAEELRKEVTKRLSFLPSDYRFSHDLEHLSVDRESKERISSDEEFHGLLVTKREFQPCLVDEKDLRKKRAFQRWQQLREQQQKRASLMEELERKKPKEDLMFLKSDTCQGRNLRIQSEDDFCPSVDLVDPICIRSSLLDLQLELLGVRCEFNEAIKSLRDKKNDLNAKIAVLSEKITDLQREFPLGLILPLPPNIEFEASESPEKIWQVTNESLRQLEEELGGERSSDQDQSPETQSEKSNSVGGSRRTSQSGSLFPPALSRRTSEVSLSGEKWTKELAVPGELLEAELEEEDAAPLEYVQSELEKELRQQQLQRAVSERDRLLAEADASIDAFDREVEGMYARRIDVDLVLARGELQVLLLEEKWLALKDYLPREESLLDRVQSKRNLRSQLFQKLEEGRGKEMRLEAEIQRAEQLKSLLRENLKCLISECPNFMSTLEKIYHSNDPVGSLTCPEGCDISIFNEALDLCTKRLALEEILNSCQEQKSAVTTSQAEIEKLFQAAQEQFLQMEKELIALQKEKWKTVKDLEMTLVISQNEIHCSDLSKAIVMPSEVLTGTKERLKQLKTEISATKAHLREKWKKKQTMTKTTIRLQSDLEKLEGEKKEAARKKFGSPDVDSDATELLLLSRPLRESQGSLDALKEDLDAQQKHLAREVDRLERELLRVTNENTQRKRTMELMQRRRDSIEALLVVHRKALAHESKHPWDVEEKILELQALMTTIEEQESVLEGLRLDVLSLKSKASIPPPPATLFSD